MTLLKSLLVASLLFIATPAHAESARDLAKEEANRKLVVDFYNQVFNDHDVAGGAEILVDDYIQHNPHVPNGKAPFVSYFVDYFKKNPQAKSRIARSAVDNDLVYLHVHATASPEDRGQAVIDILRVKDGKIVEHWDVIQDVPEKTASGNSMF